MKKDRQIQLEVQEGPELPLLTLLVSLGKSI